MKPNAQRVMIAVCEEARTWHELMAACTTPGTRIAPLYPAMGLLGFTAALDWLMVHKLVHQIQCAADEDGGKRTVFAPALTAWTCVNGKPMRVEYSTRDRMYVVGEMRVAWANVYPSEAAAVRAVENAVAS